MISRNVSLFACVLFAAACASNPPARPAASDPSSTGAPQSAPLNAPMPAGEPQMEASPPEQALPSDSTPAAAQTTTPPAAPATDPHAGHKMQDSTAKPFYVCPMHPEVTSPTPGKCPKCGMNLKRRE